MDQNGTTVGSLGTRIIAAGGYDTDPPLTIVTGVDCLPADAEIAYVQSEVRSDRS